MRTLWIVLVGVVLWQQCSVHARPAEDDFTIDMYQGSKHLRYERSSEESPVGTVVTIESTGKDAQHAAASTTKVEKVESEPVKLEEALLLVRNANDKLEAQHSAQETPAAAATIAASKPAETVAAKTETSAVSGDVVETAKVEPSSISSSSSLISMPHQTETANAAPPPPTAVNQWSQKYVNPYGNVLNRINLDKAQLLASSRYKVPLSRIADRASSSMYRGGDHAIDKPSSWTRTLSGPAAALSPSGSKSYSRVSIGGVDVNPDKLASPRNNFQGSFNPVGSLTAGFGDLASNYGGKNNWSPFSGVKKLSFPRPPTKFRL